MSSNSIDNNDNKKKAAAAAVVAASTSTKLDKEQESNNDHNNASNNAEAEAEAASSNNNLQQLFPYKIHVMLREMEETNNEDIVSWLPCNVSLCCIFVCSVCRVLLILYCCSSSSPSISSN